MKKEKEPPRMVRREKKERKERKKREEKKEKVSVKKPKQQLAKKTVEGNKNSTFFQKY